MAIRTIRVLGDSILTKECKPIKEVTDKIRTLAEDMLDTMYEANGCGLAGPQVGILKRIFVMDCGDGPIVMINPEIISKEGEQTGEEGCLSYPGKSGIVTRPEKVVCKAYDLDMNEFTIEGEGLLARCICHEYDHLDGHMYVELAGDTIRDVVSEEE